jgi:hypothetical protein
MRLSLTWYEIQSIIEKIITNLWVKVVYPFAFREDIEQLLEEHISFNLVKVRTTLLPLTLSYEFTRSGITITAK